MSNSFSVNNQNGLEIAIIGMAGRFPGAKSIEQFWQNICDGVESISFFSRDELLAAGLDEGEVTNPAYVNANAIIEDAECFDAGFFGYSPREAEVIDPQQRLFLECAQEALEHAGYGARKQHGSIGVYASSTISSYFLNNIYPHYTSLALADVAQDMIANDKDFLATRVSYKLGLEGPAIVVQSACSSSLVAVHLACQGLLSGECSMALAGGVSIRIPQMIGYRYQEGGTFSPDGHCRAFDAQAQGTVSGNGAGIVVLKRLEEALADGDFIYAAIKGSAINNDGSLKVGYTAPGIQGQAKVIKSALAVADVEPETIGYIEAHGTGTLIGDPIEVSALTQAFRSQTEKKQYCAIGSVKANIGHLDVAAGVVGLIKAVCALSHQELPPSLHFHEPNPALDLANSPFYVNTSLTKWEAGATPRRAGVSSFGMGGTNAHVILEEAPQKVSATLPERPWQLLLLSARSEPALYKASSNLARYLQQHPQLALPDVAYTLQVGRQAFNYRQVVVCKDLTDAAQVLETRDPTRLFSSIEESSERSVAFLFPGQGAQYVQMGQHLYYNEAVFRAEVDRCAAFLAPYLGLELQTLLFPAHGPTEQIKEQLNQTRFTQPALFTIEYALAKLWQSWGLQPIAMIGHSLGEYTAACLAGVFSLEDALRLIAVRGQLMQQVPHGAMLAVPLSEQQIQPLLGEPLCIAAVNAPDQCVVSGDVEEVENLALYLQTQGIDTHRLHTSHAFHSVMIEPVLAAFASEMRTVALQNPQIPYISCVTGTWITAAQATDPDYWVQQMRQPVRFADGIQELLNRHNPVLLEVGPGRALSTFAKHQTPGRIPVTTTSMPRATEKVSDLFYLMASLGRLWLSGVPIAWPKLYTQQQGQRVPLPAYPFERQRYWIEPPPRTYGHAGYVPVSVQEEVAQEKNASLYARPHITTAYVAPRDQREQIIAEIWQQLLGIDRVGIYDNFFELGGHSLMATRIISRLQTLLHVHVPLRDLFEAPTIVELAERIASITPQEGVEQALSIVPAKREGAYPLSFAQQRLWFLHEMEQGNSSFYNIPTALRLQGSLKLSLLERSIHGIVLRHEALRTTFATIATVPMQIIASDLHISVSVIDLRTLSATKQNNEAQRLSTVEAQRLFDLTQGPLVRVTLLRLDEQEHVLLLTTHHIISDGWSIEVFVREMVNIYNTLSGVETTVLRNLPIQYVDYALEQQKRLREEVLAEQLAYWQEQLRGSSLALDLPFDHPRPPVQTYRGAHQLFSLPESLVMMLKTLSQREGVTLFMTLLAAFQVVLWRSSGQEDVCVGTPIANRTQGESEDLIGLFVNTLVLRGDLSGNPSFLHLLQRTREVCLGAYAHQEMPLEKLVEVLQPQRDLSRSPLFQVMFVLQNAPLPPLHSCDFTLSLLHTESGTSLFDLTMFLIETEGRLQGRLEYNTDLFEAPSIQRLLEHWSTVLQDIVQQPELPVSQLRLLSPQERHWLLRERTATRQAYPLFDGLHQQVAAQAQRTPDAIALCFGERQLSYQALEQYANHLAAQVQAAGLPVEGLVGIYMQRSLELPIALLAVLKAGGAYVPLEPEYPAERVRQMLWDTRLGFVWTQQEIRDRLPADPDCQVWCLDGPQSMLLGASASSRKPQERSRGEQLAYVIYTSGSTGIPKGAMNTHRAVTNRLLWMQQQYPLRPGETVLQKTPFSFDVSVWEFFWPLLAGARVVLAQPQQHRDPFSLATLIEQQQVSTLHFVPSMLHIFLKETRPSALSRVRQVFCSGEALSFEVQQQFFAQCSAPLYNLYGPTETAIEVSYWECERESRTAVVPIGYPIANIELYVLDAQGQPVPIGVAGELYIGGIGVGRGYLRRPELTAEKFVPHPFAQEAGARLYRTGDLVRYRADGALLFLGRIDQQVKINGNRIELGEIEAALKQYPGIDESVVFVRELSPGDQRLMACLVVEPASKLVLSDLRAYLRERLPDYMLPSSFVQVDALPLTPSGKVNRQALLALKPESIEQGEGSTVVYSPLEELIAGIWREILGLNLVGIHENFFELGGHSLLAMQMVSRIRTLLHTELPLRSIFEAPTLKELAHYVEQVQRGEQRSVLPAITKVPRDNNLPLSFAQQRLWFLDHLEAIDTAYIIPIVARVQGTLDVEILERSLNKIVQRHEILRTVFPAIDGLAVQIVEAEPVIPFVRTNLSHIASEQREILAARLVREEISTPFDLARGPLIRMKLLHLDVDEHILLLTMHHIISDGWSSSVLVREIMALYAAFVEGKPSPLAELPIQYADYAVWQRQVLQGEVLERQLEYWTHQLEGVTPLDLPTDHSRPAVQSYRGAYQSVSLPQNLLQDLRALSQREGVTLFMTLLAAFQVVLWRSSGQEDVCVGTPIANRTQGESEDLIGLFVNTLVLRGDLSGNPSFLHLLQRTREVCLGAYAHQEMPLEKLVEVLQPQRDLSRSPLFQVMFSLQNTPQPLLRSRDFTLAPLEVENGTAKFELMFDLTETEGRLQGRLEYNTDLFEAPSIQRLLEHWSTVLQDIVQQPELPVSQLRLLSPQERHWLLRERTATRQAYPLFDGLHQQIAAQAQRTPDAIALCFGERQLSYQALEQYANHLAAQVQAAGLPVEGLVGIYMQRSLELPIALLAVLKAGGAYVPLEPEYPAERVRQMLWDTHLGFVWTQQEIGDRLPASPDCQVWCLDGPQSMLLGASASSRKPQERSRGEQLAYVIYTSGSTGTPKGAMNTHRAVTNRLLWMQQQYPLRPGETVLQKTPFSFDVSVWEFFWPLVAGARVVLAQPQQHRDPFALATLIEQQQVSTLHFVPSMLHVFLKETRPSALSRVRQVFCSGEALSFEVQQQFFAQWSAHLHNLYGPTEAAVDVSYWECEQESRTAVVPIGYPIANIELYVLDAQGQPVPIGVAGELYIGGIGVGRGYLRRPELTAEKFVPHPFAQEAGARLYRTGDLVRYRADGALLFLGRIDQQVKINGNRIELGEIEAALDTHPAINESVVMAREDLPGSKRLVAYIVIDGEHEETNTLSDQQLRDYLQERLPDYMLPTVFVRLASLPLTPNGKLDRRALPVPDMRQQSNEEAFVAPRTPLEKALAEIWADVLGLKQVSIRDNFFALGGDSILSVQITSRATQQALKLTTKQLFQHQTIEELARVVTTDQFSQAEQGLVTGPVPLTPIQRWFFSQQIPNPHYWNHAVLLEMSPQINGVLLEKALKALLVHHDALRLRFSQQAHSWQQMILEPEAEIPYLWVDLSSLAEPEQNRIVAGLDSQLQASLHLSKGPLLQTAFFGRGLGREPLFLIIMHHLLVDSVSWTIILEDLQTAYQQLSQGSGLIQLPFKTTSFKHWAEHLVAYAQSSTMQQELSYWLDEAHARVLTIPVDYPLQRETNTESSTRRVSKSLTQQETQVLLEEVPHVYSIQMKEILLAALAQAFTTWAGQSSILIDLEGHGREEIFEDINVSRTVGWFTSIYPALLDFNGTSSIGEAVNVVKEQLRQIPNRGIGYGILRYLSANTDIQERLKKFPQSDVLFNYSGSLKRPLSSPNLFGKMHPSTELIQDVGGDGVRMYLIEINGVLNDGQFESVWRYSEHAHRDETIEYLATTFIETLRALIASCQSSAGHRDLPADVSGKKISQEQLERVTAEIGLQDADKHNIVTVDLLTPVQLGMLYETIRTPGSGMHIEQSVCTLRGNLDLAIFQQAWQWEVDRHAALRTCFVWEEQLEPLQVVMRHAAIQVQVQDWRELSSDEQANRLALYLKEDRQRGFSLSLVPLIRLALFQTEANAYRFVWTHHHILLDGWSCQLVIKEMLLCYQALCVGEPLQIERSYPYENYLAWLKQRDLRDAEQFWKTTLQGFTRPTALGREEEPTSDVELEERRADQKISLPASTTAMLQALARQHHLTMNTLLQGIWSLLLSHYSGTDDVVFGITVSGRPPELHRIETMVGLCINTLPIRIHVTADDPLWSWFNAIQDYNLDLRQYEYSPGGLVHQWSDVPGAFLLYESLLVVENYPIDRSLVQSLNLQLSFDDIWSEGAQTKYPLTFLVTLNTELEIACIYDARRFTSHAISYVLEHFKMVLEHLATESVSQSPVALRDILPSQQIPVVYTVGPKKQFSSTMPFAAPRTPVEDMLAEIWRAVLGLEQVDIHQSFFEQGGHSLSATQLVSRVRAHWHIDLPLRTLFEAPTIALLAEKMSAILDRPVNYEEQAIEIVSRDQALPLSFAQQRLWFLSRLRPDNTSYNIVRAVRIQGPMRVEVLRRSLEEIVSRHESLRTTFLIENKEVVQHIASSLCLPLAMLDLTNLSKSVQESMSQLLIKQEAHHGFDLLHGPLMRVHMLRLSNQEHILLYVFHHIVFDVWSEGVLFRELGTLYEAFAADTPSPLPPLPLQYADFAFWQQKVLQGEKLAQHMAYWQKRLTGAPVLKLPTDRPEKSVHGSVGASLPFTFPQDFSETLISFSNREGVTLFMTLLAAFQTLLHRVTGQEDIVLGTDIANRTRVETESLIGFFVNLLALRTDLSGNPPFRKVLQQVRENVLDAYAHQDAPFEKLIEKLQPGSSIHQLPLVRSLFVLQNVSMPSMKIADLTLEPVEFEMQTTNFDLVVFMWQREQSLIGCVNYSTDLFDASTIANIIEHFKVLLQSLVEQPDAPVSALEIYTSEEKAQHSLKKVVHREQQRQRIKAARRSEVSLPKPDHI